MKKSHIFSDPKIRDETFIALFCPCFFCISFFFVLSVQIKNVIPNGPAWTNGVLAPGDLLVRVNGRVMLGASQDDACAVFKAIPVGEPVDIQVCRGYPLLIDPSNKVFC